jgi:hypothetical protein
MNSEHYTTAVTNGGESCYSGSPAQKASKNCRHSAGFVSGKDMGSHRAHGVLIDLPYLSAFVNDWKYRSLKSHCCGPCKDTVNMQFSKRFIQRKYIASTIWILYDKIDGHCGAGDDCHFDVKDWECHLCKI